MKLLFIYDNTDLQMVTETVGRLSEAVPAINHRHVLTIDDEQAKRKLYDVAVDIKKEISVNKDCIIFIDQYLACADEDFEWLQRNAGIALIKFLRMLEVRNHIVFVTPFAGKEIELVKQNPANLILTSKGISFSKSLYEFKNKSLTEIGEFAQNKFDEKQDLKPYILAEFRLPEDERHNWANWWGIDRLWNIHRVVEKEKYGTTERWNLQEYPDSLKNKIKELKNRQALYLYGHQDKIILTRLKEVNDEIVDVKNKYIKYSNAREDFIKQRDTIKNLIKEKTFEITNIESNFNYLESRSWGLNGLEAVFSQKRAECIRRITALSEQIRELQNSLIEEKGLNQNIREIGNRITKNETTLDSLKKQFEEEGKKYIAILKNQINELDTEVKSLQSRILSKSVSAIREKLQNQSPKILYVDDQASDGWGNIFQHIIYGKEDKEQFDIIQPKEKDTINSEYFIKIVSPKIISHQPELILLDLRLNRESGVRIEVENLSGAVLLKEIRKQYPGIPVLMTTASNKSWSYEELQRIGCDAFWTKEGVDTGMTEVDSIKNYMRFAELVNILTEDDYKFMSEFSAGINKLSDASTFWWEDSQYANNKKVDKDEVITILKHTLFIIREYLKNEVINPYKNEQQTNWLLPALIIHNLGKIPELIYNTWKSELMFDKQAQDLYKLRNSASHIVQQREGKEDKNEGRKNVKTLTFSDAKEQCIRILAYLQLKKKPDVIEFSQVPDATLVISREQLMKNVDETNKKKNR